MSNPLVAKVEDSTKSLTGAGPFDTAEDLVRDVALPFQEGKSIDPVALGIDAVAMGFDIAGAVADPLGTLASSVVGWIIENVDFVRKPFDDLAGDPPAIEAAANTWDNISKRLAEIKDAHQDDLAKLGGWTGPAAEAYKTRAGEVITGVNAAAEAAASVVNKIKVAAALVAATRTLIRDLLADLAGTLLAWGIPAAAAAVPTAGASVAAFITRAITKAVEIGGKIAQFLKKLFGALDKLSALAKRAGAAMRKQSDDLAALARSAPNTPHGNQRAAELLDSSATRASRADGLDRAGDGLADTSRRGQDAVDNATRRADDWASNTNQRVTDWADRVKQGGDARARKVRDVYDRLGQPPLTTRGGAMPDPSNGVQRAGDRLDGHTGGGVLDGQNWVRAVASRDIGHLMPTPGDVITPVKEGLKEFNGQFWAEEDQKWKNDEREP
ncbi:WXG100 family type VII secretion target [Umezawaea sp. NPDC059074]|uniref:WXG100 family type VII secretion target n=1 Tax=Umezawaea sp. NPDC059074 TaxID=3346716 RepID=UPI00368D5602